jgi:hypothetical protein
MMQEIKAILLLFIVRQHIFSPVKLVVRSVILLMFSRFLNALWPFVGFRMLLSVATMQERSSRK